MIDADFIAAMAQALPLIVPPDPIDRQEASEGICAQEDTE